MASAPWALPHESWLIPLVTSSVVGGKSSSTLVSTCGSQLIAGSFTEEGQFRTESKCSAQRSRIWDRSVSSVLPSEDRSGEDPDGVGP